METIKLPDTLPAPLQRVHISHFSNLDLSQSGRILSRIIAASKLPTAIDSSSSAEQVKAADEERALLDFAFIDPKRLCNRQHITTAVLQAAMVCARSWEETGGFVEGQAGSKQGGMKTKTPHSEIIYSLNPGNNVGESLKRFGLSSKSISLLLVKFSDASTDPMLVLEQMQSLLTESAQGSPGALTVPTNLSSSATSQGIDQAIRTSSYAGDAKTVTDWKELNKIYKLAMPSELLSSAVEVGKRQALRKYEEICCTSVAMKLVAA